MDFLKTVAGKVISGAVALAVIVAGVSWWRMDPANRHAIVSGIGRILAWLGIVLIVPWATFSVIGRVGKVDNNLAGAALVFAYTVVELVLLFWLFGWSISGAGQWTFVGLGGLVAAVYNLFTCDWIAEKVG